MSVMLPTPKSITADEVVLSRKDWERLVSALAESEEDADDIAAVAAARAENAALAARIEAERGGPVETTIPIEIVEAELDGAHPVRAWREYRGWNLAELAAQTGMAPDAIAQIETRRENGSIQSLNRLARALGVPLESLIEDDEISMGET
jgi:ribosome-binding protein aMBF1 (putative translation factor)